MDLFLLLPCISIVLLLPQLTVNGLFMSGKTLPAEPSLAETFAKALGC